MSRVKLDFFSLPWMGDDPRQSRSAGLMAVEYQGKLDRQLMETTIVDLMLNYPFFCSTISEEDGAYFFEVPDNCLHG